MSFPKSRILSAKRLSQLIKESNNNGERFCFILGSGASVESGIQNGTELEMRWMDCLMGEAEDNGTPVMDVDETKRIAEALFEEKQIDHQFEEIEEAWTSAKLEGKSIPSEYYFDIYKLRFHANPRNGYSYLEKIMERCEPSLGYHTLAKLLVYNNLNNLVITTNFDSLVEDALFLYTDKKPLVVSHESLAGYIEANIQRPIIAKVHRGLMFAPFNSTETTNELKKEWRQALSYAFGTYTPIVIGYAGGDRSLMAFLEEESTIMRNGVYWCYWDGAGLPEDNIQQFVKNKGGFFVPIKGFDALMMEIGETLYKNEITPSGTEKHLKNQTERRIQIYNEQWKKLNEKPEMKEVLQLMNEAQQREEELREEKSELTYWDYIRRGNRANEENRRDDAVLEYSKAIGKDPNNAVAYNNRGVVYRDLKENELAVKDFIRAIELDVNYAFAYNNRGISYDNLKLFDKAIDEYNKAIELNPNDASFFNNRGVAYKNLGELEKAIEDYNKAIELDPTYVMAHNNRGNAYLNLSQFEKAIEDYDKAIEFDSNYAIAYNNRGNAYDELEQYEKAIENYNKAIELKPDFSEAYNNRGDTYRKLTHFDEAIKDFDKAIALDPSYVLAYHNRGMAYDDWKQFERAIEDYDKAIQLKPDYAISYNDRGVAYKNLGLFDKAVDNFSQAILLNPRFQEAYSNRGEAYRALGQESLALADEKLAEML